MEIQNYIDDKVKKLLVKTKTAKQWKVLKVAHFKNLSNRDVILLLQDYCTPTSRTEFYMNLKAATTYRSENLVFDIKMHNFESFYKEIDMYVERFKYAYTFLLDYRASKHEIPYTNVKSKDIMTLRYLYDIMT